VDIIVTESRFAAKLLSALRQHPALKDAVIWKLSDRTTRGIPDFVVTTREGHTTWWEVKVAPNKLAKIQSYYLTKLRYSWCVILLKHNSVTIQPQGMPVNTSYFFGAAVELIVQRCRDA